MEKSDTCKLACCKFFGCRSKPFLYYPNLRRWHKFYLGVTLIQRKVSGPAIALSMSVRYCSAIFLVLISNWALAGGRNGNSPLQALCIKYLLPEKKFTVADVRSFQARPIKFVVKDENDPLQSSESVYLYTHPFLQPLYFLEPADFKRLDERETADAIRFAEYLRKYGLGFLFVSVYKGVNVPAFDGVVFDIHTGEPLYTLAEACREGISSDDAS